MTAKEVTTKIKATIDEMWAELDRHKRKFGETDKSAKSEARLEKLQEATDKIRLFEETIAPIVSELDDKFPGGKVPDELLESQKEALEKLWKENKHYLEDYWGFGLINEKNT